MEVKYGISWCIAWHGWYARTLTSGFLVSEDLVRSGTLYQLGWGILTSVERTNITRFYIHLSSPRRASLISDVASDR
jgi:hypothetical protein